MTSADRGVAGNNVASASLVIVPTSNLAAGSCGVLGIAADNANNTASNMPSTMTDSVGNVWKRYYNGLGSGGANANIERAMYASDLTVGFTTSNSLTLTFTAANVTAKCWALIELVPAVAGNICLHRTITAVTAISTTGTPTTSTGVNSAGDIIVGFGGAESADTWVDDADTTNGSWSASQHTGAGSGATGMSIISQRKTLSASGAQTFNPTLTSADVTLFTFTFTEAPPKARACFASGATAASQTVTFNRSLAAGSIGVLCFAADNAGTNGSVTNFPSSLTDSQSNTWTLRQNDVFDNGAASAGAEVAIYTAPITTPLANGDTVVVTYTIASVGNKAWCVFEFSDATAYATGAVGTGATTGTPTVTTSSITIGDYVIGVAALEGDDSWTGDADTTNGSWSQLTHALGGTTGTGAMALAAQYKKVTTGGAQTFNPTCTSGDIMIGWIELTVPTVTNTGAFFEVF